MSIEFKILWIDDSEDYLESLNIDFVDKHINDQGFKVKFEFRITDEDIDMDVDGLKYDLIVIDYNLANDGSKTGASVIRSVREKNCLTEVIFYSAKSISILRQVAFDQELEGVFFSSRDADGLLNKICTVFDLKIKRLIDLDNIRGLVMSGVADIDMRLKDIIINFNNNFIEEHQINLRKKIVEKMMPEYRDIRDLFSSEHEEFKNSFNTSLKNFKNLEPKQLEDLLSNRAFSSSRRVETVMSICQRHTDYDNKKAILDDICYLLHWRNALAHQNPETVNDERVFQVGKENISFNTTESKKILRQLIDLEQRLDILSIAQ
ncbi:response regulator [Yersinia enterocolitica]|uniref:Prophage encoded two-component system response regulator n=1 Tax=Yersinia enterocolitica serotype O:8 / biotype 1B (strain NCTC 13174 / 8081) TaxID=393305 RepID=A1JNJ7_YERE8|nr:response regulator [Yersinia enterocolitica]AJJ23963.1 response regulator [Yersinia enterocolitica]CAL11757.1 putative prophage encoded two-component system response regulator [Yersinia enterocolitica subsp. enterocolitica 8081]HDL8282917.1 response regulator [Yersinia enterocolitica]